MKLGVIKSLRPMLNLLLPNDDLREEVYDYLPLLLAEYQGSLEALFITQVRAVQELTWAGGLVLKCTGEVEGDGGGEREERCHLDGRWDV